MLRRRTIGPAYERCPSERVGDWSRRNLVALITATVVMVLWWLAVRMFTVFLNWMHAQDHPDDIPPYYDGLPMFVSIKLIGGIILFILVSLWRSK
ncbi:MAG: hypothetical protein MK193_09530 [Lentisphaeria bacterium]|nr:hypothetical protein [Lentisphaeria bacterium]